MYALEKARAIQLPMPFEIPAISDELIEKLSQTMKPVVEVDDHLFYIEPVDPRRTAFTWSPTVTNHADDLEFVAVIPTLHKCGSGVFFKPSIAEVLAQIPAGYIDQIVAFRTTITEEQVPDWTDAERQAFNWSYHLGSTTLYKRAS